MSLRLSLVSVLAAVALAAVALAAVACGTDTGEPEPAAAPPASTEAPPTTAPADEPDPDAPAAEEPEPDEEPQPEPPVEPEPPTAESPVDSGLPAAVAATREAILDAARTAVRTGDYTALEALVDPESFTYSFGESGDPIGYWRELEEVAEMPVLGDFLPVVLGWPWAKRGDVYVWPSAHAKLPDRWRPADTEPLLQLYTLEEIEAFRGFGAYAGWRVGILENGTWIYFVAGD